MEEKTTDLSKILSIAGKPGLYMMVSKVKTGVVVESLVDGKRFQAFTHDKVSSLEEISVFTDAGNKPLREIFQNIREKTNNGLAPTPKADNQTLKSFFESVMPDYDRDRVYVSHMKKIYAWYNLLHEKHMLNVNVKEEEAPEQPEPEKKEAGADAIDKNASDSE